MKRISLFAAILFTGALVSGQQLHFTSQYILHNSMYNPAAAGMSENKTTLGITYRDMWAAFPGNPRTFMVYVDHDWTKMNAGLGGYIYRDQTGPTTRTGVQLAYSYHVKTGGNGKLGLGIELRGLQFAIDRSKLSESVIGDPTLMGADKKTTMDAGFGIYYVNGPFSGGAAVSQLISSKLDLASVQGSNLRARLYRHYNLTSSYRIQTGEDIYLIPNFMLRVVENSPTEFDFGCKVDFQDKIWWALNWRVNQFWSAQMGLKLMKKIGVSYSYDYYVTPLSLFNAGSYAHEVGLNFDLK